MCWFRLIGHLSDIYRTFGLIEVEPKKVDLRELGLNERLKSVEHAEKMGSITNREYQRFSSMLLNESKNWLVI
jgi:hypothetical protein